MNLSNLKKGVWCIWQILLVVLIIAISVFFVAAPWADKVVVKVMTEEQLESHCSDFKRVYDYYREGILTSDQVLEILLWDKIQNGGVFVRLADTNPRIDKFFVEYEAYKRSLEYQKLLEKGK